MLTDRFPYSSPDDGGKFLLSRFEKDLVPANKFNVMVNKEMDNLLAACLAIDPKKRPQTAKELLIALERLDKTSQEIKTTLENDQQSVDSSKSALGMHDPASEGMASKKARKAQRIARQSTKIIEAADLMEEAINEWPLLQDEYGYMINLWRRGLTM